MEHLRDQLMLLTEAIDVNHEALREPLSKPLLVDVRRRKVLHRGAKPDPLDLCGSRAFLDTYKRLCFATVASPLGGDCPEHDLSQAVSPSKATYACFEAKHRH